MSNSGPDEEVVDVEDSQSQASGSSGKSDRFVLSCDPDTLDWSRNEPPKELCVIKIMKCKGCARRSSLSLTEPPVFS